MCSAKTMASLSGCSEESVLREMPSSLRVLTIDVSETLLWLQVLFCQSSHLLLGRRKHPCLLEVGAPCAWLSLDHLHPAS